MEIKQKLTIVVSNKMSASTMQMIKIAHSTSISSYKTCWHLKIHFQYYKTEFNYQMYANTPNRS